MNKNSTGSRSGSAATIVPMAIAVIASLLGPALAQPAGAATYEGGGEFVEFAGVTRTTTIEVSDHGEILLTGVFESAAYSQQAGAIAQFIEALEATPGPPQILLHPVGLTLTNGANASFTIEFVGALPNTIQWLKNDRPISQETGTLLNVTAVARADEGDYNVVVTGPGGATRSDAAQLRVLTQQRISLIQATNGTTRFRFGDADGKPLPSSAIKKFTMQISTDLQTWRDIPANEFTLTLIDGELDFAHTAAPLPGVRFYRILER